MAEKVAEFKIGSIIYNVFTDETIMASDQALGLCDYVQAKISLYPHQNEQRMEQVLFHEVLHAIFSEAGYDEQDEDMINRVGIVFHQFLQENFKFVGHDGIKDRIAENEAEANAEYAAAIEAQSRIHKHPVGFDTSVVHTGNGGTANDESDYPDDESFEDEGTGGGGV